MKKIYVKPMLVFQSFKMASSIAGDCDDKTNNPTENSCPVVVPGYISGTTMNLFLNDVIACTTVAPDGSSGVCYHAPTEATNLFNS